MPEPGVEKRLYEEPYLFDFFQAVRLLARLAPDRTLVGGGGPPSNEIVRFGVLPSLNFPPSAIYSLGSWTTDSPVPRMLVSFFGLTGPSGVMPRHYTDLIYRLERERKGEERRALREWFDLFNHRLISLFYRAWEKYRFWVGYERGDSRPVLDRGSDLADPFNRVLFSFIGLGTGGLHKRLHISAVEMGGEKQRLLAGVDDLALLHYSGLLAQRKRTASGLAALLSDYFGVPVRIIQFVGQWLDLEPTSQTRLGVEGGNCELGVNAVAGERVHDVQGKFRIRLGPLSYARFLEFLPDRSPLPEHKAFFLLVHLTRLYAGADLDFDVRAVLQAEEVPECQLIDEPPGPRLGWNTWLTSQQPQHDAQDALFSADEVVRVYE